MTTTHLDDAIIRRNQGVSSTEYNIYGTLEGVLDAVKGLFINYNPHGYGTHLHQFCLNYGGTDGAEYYARVSRLNSCD